MSRIRFSAASAVVLGAALVLAACSSSSTATPTPTVAPVTGSTGASGTSGASGASSPSGLGGLGALGALHQNPDLENRLPAQVCGTNAFKLSVAANGLGAAADAIGEGLGGILGGLGTATSFSFAIAAPDPAAATDCGTSFFAIQIQGGDANAILKLMTDEAAKDGSTTQQTTLGGKNVTVLDDDGSKTYVYVNGDTIYGIQANDDAAAGEAISQLP